MDDERDKQFLPYGFQKHSCKLLRIIELQYLLLITANTVIKLTPAERGWKKKQLLHSTITLLTTNYCYYHYYYITIYYRYYHYYYCYYYYYYCCCCYHYYYYSITTTTTITKPTIVAINAVYYHYCNTKCANY